MTMAELKSGDIAEITGYTIGNAVYRAKLLALGLTRGVKIKIINVAPLGDLLLEPKLWLERDLMADDGTYAYFELGHTFEVAEDLTLRPAVGQGFGNSLRTKGYFGELEKVEGFEHGGIMDTVLLIDLEYTVNEWLALGAYVSYHDYLFDGDMRKAAAAYNGEWGGDHDRTWNVVGGLSATVSF